MTDKAAAVQAALKLVQQGASSNQAARQTAPTYGVSPRTIQQWAQQQGIPLGAAHVQQTKNAAAAAAEEYRLRRARLRVDMLRVAEGVLARIDGEEDGRRVQSLAVALGILVDKIRLEEGEATNRSEHIGRDEFMAEVKRLAEQMGPTVADPD